MSAWLALRRLPSSRSRRAWRVAAVVSACVGLGASGAEAHADTPPSVWDRARDPANADSYRLHLEVQRRLATDAVAVAFGFSAPHESMLLSVRSLLERANADKSLDPRLRFDLGIVYLLLGRTEGNIYFKRSAEVLGAALAMAPDDPVAEEAWANLADACGHFGDHECERRAYTNLLGLTTEEFRPRGNPQRGTAALNLAEAQMHLGNLKDAIEGYREAMRIAQRFPYQELTPLALWGLAVAYDRSGDTVAADKEALSVVEMQRSSRMVGLLRSEGVFFYPSYEISWYDAVGAAAQARRPSATAAEQVRFWKLAEESYLAFIRGAERDPKPDRWLELARVRHAAAKLAREKAEKKRGKVPVEMPVDDEELSP
jgi:tetratricopeptide (TPR) repeat protein